jgi:hypothetical protein
MTSPAAVSTLLHWRHRRGDEAHCLARLVHGPHGPVALLTELASNPEGRSVADDPAAAAEAFVRHLEHVGDPVDTNAVVWLLQHGQYSYPDASGEPESYTRLRLTWRDDRYTEDPDGEELLDQHQQNDLLGAPLPSVQSVLAQLPGATAR